MSKKKIIVTGATGYLGKAFANNFQKKYDIYCIVRKKSKLEELDSMRCSIIVYNEIEELYDIAKNISPDVLVHFAGVFLNEHSKNTIRELLECNLLFGTTIVDAVVEAGCKNIINTSSYWQKYKKAEYNPVNLYAATKQGFEDILRYYYEVKRCNIITLTIFDTYGPNDKRKKILNIINELPDGATIEMSSGEQKMYFVYVDDVMSAYDVAIERCYSGNNIKYENFALRSEELFTLKTVAEKLIKIANKNVEFRWGEIPNRKREISDPKNIGIILPGWNSNISIEEGLKRLIDGDYKELK